MKRSNKVNFNERPILVFWETTKACKLACKHCRAEAIEKPLPGELTTEEGIDFIDSLTEFGKPYPILILTGGDPLMRQDIYELIAHAKKKVPIGLAPSVTPMLSLDTVSKLRDLGVKSISISLDGAKPETHDGIRGISNHFAETLKIIKELISSGFHVQVNTTVMRNNVSELADILNLLLKLRVKVWEVFFLIKVGRGAETNDIMPAEYEDVMHFLFDASMYGVKVRTVEAPFFRRVVKWRLNDKKSKPVLKYRLGSLYIYLSLRLRGLLGEPKGEPMAHVTESRDGKGIIFVSYSGDVYPSGFLPYSLGNIRVKRLSEIYRKNDMLIKIRAAKFKGKCGVCEYKDLCGGSRARAFAEYGDPLAEDPACIYVPKGVLTIL